MRFLALALCSLLLARVGVACAETALPPSDRDGDRIPDAVDVCPDAPETYNGFADEDGCPDTPPPGAVKLVKCGLDLLDRIYFARGAATIMRRQWAALDAAAATLRGNPQIRAMDVIGHAGAEPRREELAQRRADAVVAALVQRGVDASRLRATTATEPGPPSRAAKHLFVSFEIRDRSGPAAP